MTTSPLKLLEEQLPVYDDEYAEEEPRSRTGPLILLLALLALALIVGVLIFFYTQNFNLPLSSALTVNHEIPVIAAPEEAAKTTPEPQVDASTTAPGPAAASNQQQMQGRKQIYDRVLGEEAAIDPLPSAPRTIDDVLKVLKTAKVGFNPPKKTIVKHQLILEAKLSAHLTAEDLKLLFQEPGTVEVAPLKVSDRIAATLSGGSAFEISPSGPQEQWISESETTNWTWHVTPLSSGHQTLILSFDAIVSFDGKDDKRNVNTLKREIDVEVEPTSLPQSFADGLQFVKENGENLHWVWGTLLVPLVGGIWTWFRRRSRSVPADQNLGV